MRLPRLLDGNLKEVKRLHPVSCSINEKIVPLSYANMVVRTAEIVPERSWVELYTINGSAGIYRTRAPQSGYGTDAQIQLEHGVGEIGDFLVTDSLNEELTCANAIRKLMTYYRGNKWQFGSCSCNGTVTLNADYDNVLESILGVLEQVTDYVLSYDFTTKPWKLNVVRKETTVTAEGRLGRNVVSATIRKDDKDLCTRVYVRGLPKPEGRENDENAVGYLDADTISQYGPIEHEESGGSDLTEAQARRIAETYLKNHKKPRISVEIDASDLSAITGETLDSFRLGKLFRLAIPEDNLVLEDIITAVDWDDVYGQEMAVRLTLGDERDPAIQFYRAQASAAKSAGKSAKGQAKKNEAFEQNFQKTDEYGAILEQAGMKLDANGLIVYARDNVNNIGSLFTQTKNEIRQYVASADAAAEIVARINESTGESEIKLDAQRVYIGNQKSTTVINGKLNASDVTAEYLNAKISLIARMTTQAIDADSVTIRPVSGMGAVNIATAYNGSSLTLSGNTYKLRLAKMNGNYDEWSFSRATTLSGAWGSGTFTVNASPQSQQITSAIYDLASGDTSWSGTTGTVKVYANLNGDDVKRDTGKRLTVHAPFSSVSLAKAYDMTDTVYYGRLYDSSGNALTSGSYYWYGSRTNYDGGSANATFYRHT